MEIYDKLRAHFSEDDIDFKVGATNKEKTMGLALAYVDARAIQERLDSVVGCANWEPKYREVQGGFICSLSIRIDGEWITKEDGAQVTAYESVKGGMSSAFKRVASSGFGIGRYLYDNESTWYPIRSLGKGYEFTINPTLSLNKNPSPAIQAPTTIREEKDDTKGVLGDVNPTVTSPQAPKKNGTGKKKMTLEKAASLKWPMGSLKGTTLGIVYKRSPNQIKYFFDKAYEGKFDDIKEAIALLDKVSPEHKRWEARLKAKVG